MSLLFTACTGSYAVHIAAVNRVIDMLISDPLGFGDMPLDFRVVGALAQTQPSYDVVLRHADWHLTLQCHHALIMSLLPLFLPELAEQDLKKTPGTWLVRLIVDALARVFAVPTTNVTCDVLANDVLAPADIKLDVVVSSQHHPLRVRVHQMAEPREENSAAKAFAGFAAAQLFPIALRFHSAPVFIGVDALASLCVGDAIILPQAQKSHISGQLRIGPNGVSTANFKDGVIEMMQDVAFEDMDEQEALEALAAEMPPPEQDIEAIEPPTPPLGTMEPFASVKVRLDFVIGGTTYTLAELSQLRAGSFVTLDQPLDDAVQITSNGQRVGTGKLFAVDDKIAVQLTHWPLQQAAD